MALEVALQEFEKLAGYLADGRRLDARDFRQLFRSHTGFHDGEEAVLTL